LPRIRRILDMWRDHATQPEPQGPTDEALMAAARDAVDAYPRCSELPYFMSPDSAEYEPLLLALRAAARWGRPVIEPVPVAERLPGPEDCDAEGTCWLTSIDTDPGWVIDNPEKCKNWTHWLPHHALPVPQQEVQ
jgi:hypothetical protein